MTEKGGRVIATLPADSFDPHAVELIRWLKRFGFKAYIVGGSVRDILLGRTPKDFDVVTSATPEEVRELVPNSRIIGRRFKLVHVYVYDRDGVRVMETSTLRLKPRTGEEGRMLRRDNEYGDSPEEDAVRRDFTVNAFYYDVDSGEVYDFVGQGLQDLEGRVLRTIGDPDVRFREDPVRIMRAVRFASKLGFTYEDRTLEFMKKHAPLIKEAAPRRVKDEMWKMLLSSYGGDALRQFMDFGFMHHILPSFDSLWRKHDISMIIRALRKAAELPEGVVDKTVLTPLLLYPLIKDALDQKTFGAAREHMPGAKKIRSFLKGLGFTYNEMREGHSILDDLIYVRVMTRRSRKIRQDVRLRPEYPRVLVAMALLDHALEGTWNDELIQSRVDEVARDRAFRKTRDMEMVARLVRGFVKRTKRVTPYINKEFPELARRLLRRSGVELEGEPEAIVPDPGLEWPRRKKREFRPIITEPPRPFDLFDGSVEYYRDPLVYEHEFKSYKRDIEFYRVMGQSIGGPILDLGCGTGRLMTRWVADGLDVVGVDLNPAMLERAHQRLGSLGPTRRSQWKLVQDDMVKVRLRRKFRLAVSAFNTMMHIYTREDMKRFLSNVRRHLDDDGTFVFDIQNPNFEWLAQDPSQRWGVKRFKHPRHGVWYYYSSNHYYDAESQIVYIYIYHEPEELTDQHQPEVIRFAQRLYFPQEMMELLEGAGFKIEGLFGHFDSRELTADAPCQVYVVSPKD